MPTAAPKPWRDHSALWVLGATLAVRLLYFATTHSPSFRDPLIDGDYYDYLGTRIASGAGFDEGPFWQPPLYPLILGALYRVLGHDLLWPRLLQALLDGATAAFATRITRTITGSPAWAVAAGLCVALHGPMLFYSGEILPTTAGAFCGMLAVTLAITLAPGWRRSVACGVSVGTGALLVAPVLVLIAPLAWVLGQKRWQRGAVALAACLSIVGCATLANWVRAHELVPISANAGINLYIGNHPDSDRLVAVRPGAEWEALAAEPMKDGIQSLSGEDAYWVRRALEACTSDALGCVTRLAGKARQLATAREIPRNESLDLVKQESWVLRVLTAGAGSVVLPYVVLIPLGVAGLIAALRRAQRSGRIVALATLFLGAVPVLFFVTGRYRVQLAPELAVLAVLGAHALWNEGRRRRPEAVAAAVALVLTVRPMHLPVDEVPFEAEMYYAIGGRRARLGDDTGAIEAWRRALELRRGYLEAGFNVALALERAGRADEARAAYRDVLAAHPGYGPASQRLRDLDRR